MIVPLAQCETYLPEEVGWKAKHLSRLLNVASEHDLEVPDGFVLTSCLARRVMEAARDGVIRELQDTEELWVWLQDDTEDPSGQIRWLLGKEASGYVRDMLIHDPELKAELDGAVNCILKRLDELTDWKFMYIRSSSNICDSETGRSSYAGALRSIPCCVEGLEKKRVLDALLAVYSSVVDSEAVLQHLQNRISLEDLIEIRVAVLFQRLEDGVARSSGMILTRQSYMVNEKSERGAYVMVRQGLAGTAFGAVACGLFVDQAIADLILVRGGTEKVLADLTPLEAFVWEENGKLKVNRVKDNLLTQGTQYVVDEDANFGLGEQCIAEEDRLPFDDPGLLEIVRKCWSVESEFTGVFLMEFAIFEQAGGPTLQFVQVRPIPSGSLP